ncbi:MAG: UDP-N-acetylmuramoyl-tripeptide--D-alanyl-D-alanine ligase [Deltaproteobacteria bacterium]|jgi:UDP-N-acetylmuramoyl-tripeptide--D-alanyl-D-alanine ligase|nr:UDP-N-acetylmuramoyl-tripeptide--D-alanyl-D-alanine ligase [Deltaproteobacteria bacterium]
MAGGELRSGPGLAAFELTLARTAELCGARLAPQAGVSADQAEALARRPIAGVATDSRVAGPGDVFWALPGERFDGADFAAQALARGAAAVVIEEGRAADLPGAMLLRVPDALAALGDLAAAVRRLSACRVTAVTGSVGKTTVKELLGEILRAAGQSVIVTPGNFNNLVGTPLTLLSLSPRVDSAVVELGASRAGEIKRLAELARPDVGLVTALGEAHLEFFGDLDEVAQAKGELYRALEPQAVAVVSAGDRRLLAQAQTFAGARILFGGPDSGAHVRVVAREDYGLAGQKLTFVGPGLPTEGLTAVVRLPGRAGAHNALAAAAAGLAAGAQWNDVVRGLEAAEPAPGRLRPYMSPRGAWIIDDSYNANPTSMAAGLEFLADLPNLPARGAILGDMLELGPESARCHRRLGRLAAEAGLDFLAVVGPRARETAAAALEAGLAPSAVEVFDDPDDAAEWASWRAPAGSATLIKASRSVGLERAVARLAARAAGGAKDDQARDAQNAQDAQARDGQARDAQDDQARGDRPSRDGRL